MQMWSSCWIGFIFIYFHESNEPEVSSESLCVAWNWVYKLMNFLFIYFWQILELGDFLYAQVIDLS